MRIVSLLPSATEILFALGAGDEVVGVTFECDYPPEARSRRVVSTSSLREGLTPQEIDAEVSSRMALGEELYRLDEGALGELDADLVVTQDLCAVCAVDLSTVKGAVDYLGCTAEVLTVDPRSLQEVLASIAAVGAAIGHREEAAALCRSLTSRLAAVRAAVGSARRPAVAVLEWTDPPFSAGHWVPDIVEAAGGTPILGRRGEDSVRIDFSEIASSAPEVIVVAPCGYHLEGSTKLALELLSSGVLPASASCYAVDADSFFVRPGPRLVDGVEGLAAALHPGALPGRPEVISLLRSC